MNERCPHPLCNEPECKYPRSEPIGGVKAALLIWLVAAAVVATAFALAMSGCTPASPPQPDLGQCFDVRPICPPMMRPICVCGQFGVNCVWICSG
jgi:hypothetical protein